MCLHVSCSVVSDSLRPHGLQPPRLLRPWDSPGKSTGVGCHCLLQAIFLTRDRTRVSCIVYLGTKKGLEIRSPQAVLSSYVVWVGPGTSSISLQRRNRETREQGQGSCLKLIVVEREASLWNRLGQDHGLIPKCIHSVLQN